MKTSQINPKYIAWLSADDMHEASKKWLSELYFTADEHLFFQDLVKTYTLLLVNTETFSNTVEIIDALNRSQKRNNELIEIIKTHENDLEVIVDDINQPKEESAYKSEHRELANIMSDFYQEYTSLKSQLFHIIKNVIKKDKQERLLDNKH